jgi:phosphate-selective porin OprO and OprP
MLSMRSSRVVSFLLAMVLPVQLLPAQTPPPAENRSIEERLQAIEDKLQQLEKRVDAATQTSTAAHDNTAPVAGGRLEALDQKVRVLERNRELDQEAALAKAKETPVITAGTDGFSISSADKKYRLKVSGFVQADGRFFYDDAAASGLNDTFTVRRARLKFDGSVGKHVDYRIGTEFGNGSVSVFDAFADVKITPYTILRGGKFKGPVGLEELAEDTDLTFIERSLVSDIIPNRDVGFQLYGDLGGRFTYQVAFLNGGPDGANLSDADTNKAKDVDGRVFFTPFAKKGPSALRGLGFGLGVTSGGQNGKAPTAANTTSGNLPSFKTTSGQIPFFAYDTTAVTGAFAAGRRLRYSPQLYYYNGPFGLMGEYVEEFQWVSNSLSGPNELNNRAFQGTVSWVITGDKKGYRGVIPKRQPGERKFFPSAGAWEIAGRYTQLDVDPNAFTLGYASPTTSAQTAHAWGIALNWYVNKNVKLAANYEQTDFDKGAVAGDRATEKTFLQRVQVAF